MGGTAEGGQGYRAHSGLGSVRAHAGTVLQSTTSANRSRSPDCVFLFCFVLVYAALWKKNQLLAKRLVDHSSIDNLHNLFSAILNSVLEDRLTNSSKPPNNLNENYKMF